MFQKELLSKPIGWLRAIELRSNDNPRELGIILVKTTDDAPLYMDLTIGLWWWGLRIDIADPRHEDALMEKAANYIASLPEFDVVIRRVQDSFAGRFNKSENENGNEDEV